MSLRHGMTVLGIVSTCALSAFACAASSDGETVSNDSDAGKLGEAPAPDAAPPPADAEAGLPPARECSDQNYCHTKVPADEVLRGVWGDGNGVVWTVGESGTVYRWDGKAWAIHQIVPDTTLTTILGFSPTDIWVAGARGIFHGTGTDPTSLDFARVEGLAGDPTQTIHTLWGTSANDLWAVGGLQVDSSNMSGRLLHYSGPSESGNGWELVDVPADDVDFQGIFASPASGLFLYGTEAVGYNTGWVGPLGVMFHRFPGSTTWQQMEVPWGGDLNDYPRGAGPITGAGVTDDGVVWVSDTTLVGRKNFSRARLLPDGTFGWEFQQQPSNSADAHVFWGSSTDDAWVAGDFGRLRHWNGSEWSQAILMVTSAPVKADFYARWGVSDEDFWIVGQGIAIHKTPVTKP